MLRSSGLFAFPLAALVRPKPSDRLNPPWLSKAAAVELLKKSCGAQAQPARSSLTMAVEIVDRNDSDPVVRNDDVMPKAGKPGNVASALFRVSGVSW